MPVKAGTPINPEATRARILASATRLFYERGVHAVGVDEIAQHAGASKLTIYRYFGSKDGLLEAVLGTRSEQVHAFLTRGLARVPVGPDRIMALFDLLARWYGEPDYRGCILVNAALEGRHLQDGPVRDIPRAHLARYRVLLTRLLDEAGVGAPEPLARQLLLLVEGAITVTVVDRDATAGHDARVAARALIDAALDHR